MHIQFALALFSATLLSGIGASPVPITSIKRTTELSCSTEDPAVVVRTHLGTACPPSPGPPNHDWRRDSVSGPPVWREEESAAAPHSPPNWRRDESLVLGLAAAPLRGRDGSNTKEAALPPTWRREEEDSKNNAN